MSKKTITRETDRSFAERALYQLLVLLIPSIMAGEHTEAGLLQTDRDMALTPSSGRRT